MRLFRFLLAAAFSAAPALCQMIGGGACTGTGTERNGEVNVRVSPVRPITGAPYSAREVFESVRTLADGTHISSSAGRWTLTWRDAAGRIRTEQKRENGSSGCWDNFITIQDPVAGLGYVVDAQGKRVYRVPLTVRPPIPAAERAASMAGPGRGDNATREDLGSRTENGVILVGERVTRTMAPDPDDNLTRRGTIVTETWTAPQLALAVETKTSNKEQGTVSTRSLKDLSTADPDPSLFLIPEDYQVIDEPAGTVQFTIGIGKNANVPPPVTASERPPHSGGCTASYHFGIPVQGEAVTGAPYSARESREEFEILADGSEHALPNIRRPEFLVWRDSAGRTRREERAAGQVACSVGITRIDDPVSGSLYEIDPVNRLAHRVAIKTWTTRTAFEIAAARDSVQPSARKGAPSRTREALGQQVMSGVTAVGTRETTTYPAGSRGNDRPMTSVAEFWYAPSLALEIAGTNSDSSHKSVWKLEDLSTAEPDPSLFQPPAGYKIVDETSSFTISISR
ncbi:MAG TPA: hypothetical protein VMB03_08970 [Bryobacteraceae bacterium]|nr:hypothetical protein [Bryobacteraceae bacterium]